MANVYRPPACETTNFKSELDLIKVEIDRIGNPMPTIIITGDFNFPVICWESMELSGGNEVIRQQVRDFIDFVENYSLAQEVAVPTRGNNILDLTNNEDLIVKIDCEETVMSDHKLVVSMTNISLIPSVSGDSMGENGFSKLNFFDRRIEWEIIGDSLMNINRNNRMEGMSVDEMYDFICDEMLKVCGR